MKVFMAHSDANSEPITWPEEFRQFHDMVYSRLDLPAPPTLDEDKFEFWSAKSAEFLLSLKPGQTTAKGTSYTSAYHENKLIRKQAFPYTMYPIMTRATSGTDKPWVAEFDKLFPDIVDYYAMFPMANYRSLGFIRQNPGMEVWDHSDMDGWIGFRFYVQNTCRTEKLHFNKIAPEHLTRNRYRTYIVDESGKPVTRDFTKICVPERVYPKNNTGTYPWALTSSLACHGIDAIELDESRLTCIMECWPTDGPNVRSGFKVRETIDLLERSISKYPAEVIWY